MRTNEDKMRAIVIEWPNGTQNEFKSITGASKELGVATVTIWQSLKRGYLYPKTKIWYKENND